MLNFIFDVLFVIVVFIVIEAIALLYSSAIFDMIKRKDKDERDK